MNKKRFFIFMVIGIGVAMGNLVSFWVLNQGKPAPFKVYIFGAEMIATFFATFCGAVASIFSFVNDIDRRTRGLDESRFAAFFSAKKTPGATGLATGFAASTILSLVTLILFAPGR